jgi:hypothetical protein
MTERVGFIILSHSNPPQLLRLVRCLQRVYSDPPIVCHHDFGQCPLAREEFPSGVRFVLPHLKTRWGQFSIVAAALRALELLYRDTSPDWFFLLSGADYPIMRPERVLEELKSSGTDALLDFRKVPAIPSAAPGTPAGNPALQHFSTPGYLALAWARYVGFNAWFPIVRRGPRLGRHTVYLPFRAWRSPFGPGFECFAGDQWFAGNRTVADVLIRPTEKHLQLRRYLRWRSVPDECYYQTVLVNTPHLRIDTATRRHCEWMGGGFHPRELGIDDLPTIIASGAFFARKFAPDSPVLEEIDRMLS